MLILKEIRGKSHGRSTTFRDRTWLLYRGRIALAKGGATQTNETVPTGPWAPQIPYINQLFQQAGNLYGGGPPQYYPGQTVLPPNQLITSTQNAAVGQINRNAPQLGGAAG